MRLVTMGGRTVAHLSDATVATRYEVRRAPRDSAIAGAGYGSVSRGNDPYGTILGICPFPIGRMSAIGY